MNLVLVFVLVLLVGFFYILFYVKKKYGFWAIQPVFHVYDLYWYLFPCGILQHTLPEKNKYCNFQDIQMFHVDQLEEYQMDQFVRLLQKEYWKEGDAWFAPDKENVAPYFHGHNAPCLISFYSRPRPLYDSKNNQVVTTQECMAAMTSRPVHLSITRNKQSHEFDAYYVDYLCVQRSQRKRGVAPQLIQTHEYWQRREKKYIPISLFKREGELTGIVPICVYSTYGFVYQETNKRNHDKIKIKMVRVGVSNMRPMLEFMKEQARRFALVGQSHMGNWVELIKTGNWRIYVAIQGGHIRAAYFFRKTCVKEKENKETAHCFASVYSKQDMSEEDFVEGFEACIQKGARVMIEEIADNPVLVSNWKKRYPYETSPTAYFFYNFVHPSFRPRDVLFLF
jgi:GNAT superfamily N-acetyltransferase